MRRGLVAALALAVAASIGGCGIGAGAEKQGGGAQLRVTRDFGQKALSERSVASVGGGQTVMRFLRSANKVTTRYGGGFVQSIDGLAGGGRGGSRDWFFYVNGIAGDRGANDFDLHPGDVVQWDYRYWKAAQDVRAIVGAYPEPFVHGTEGKRYPVRVECEQQDRGPCKTVKDALRAAGVPATGAALGTQGTENVARVVVATWPRARQLPTVKAIEQGPRTTGVFAKYAGGRLQLLDQDAHVARTVPGDTGLIAALRPTDTTLAWVVTGGTQAGLVNAARAFRASSLRNAFAVAAPPRGAAIKLPVEAGG